MLIDVLVGSFHLYNLSCNKHTLTHTLSLNCRAGSHLQVMLVEENMFCSYSQLVLYFTSFLPFLLSRMFCLANTPQCDVESDGTPAEKARLWRARRFAFHLGKAEELQGIHIWASSELPCIS